MVPGVCATTVHFSESRYTGKERDTESGNDYFGARYYASSMGRFTSPDWSATADTIPYAELDNPQSFNLYGYVVNNPLGWVDTDGHDVSDSEWMNLSSDTFNSQMQSLFQNSLHEETNNQEETSGYDSSDSGSVGYFIRPGIRKKKPRPPPGLPPELLASIYADMFEGRLTASGTVFRQSGYTAALLPRSNWHAVKMHTRVRLTHAGRSVVVDINDRGKGADSGGKLRVLDLTRAAASYLTGQPINSDSDANGVGLITVTAQPVSQDTPLGPVAPQE
jgi:RHS repeat-associated protein